MVDETFWETKLKNSIRKKKIRIQFCEKHGIGDSVIREKFALKVAEKVLVDRKL